MRGIQSLAVFVLLMMLSIKSGAVLAQEPPPGDPGIQAIEDTIHVPMDTSAYDYADNVMRAGDHGCNDYWAIFHSNYPNLPGGVWADNLINQGHIILHNGLDGYFRCGNGQCTTYLCTKHGGGANAWSVKGRW